MDINGYRIPPERLRRTVDPNSFPFQCTDELKPLKGFIGQDRAIEAIHFALHVDKAGYNLFVTGLTGTGKASAIQAHIQDLIEHHKSEGHTFQVSDWCYISNFTDPDQPKVLKLPKGRGRELRQRVEELLSTLRGEIPKIFSADEYRDQRKQTEDEGRAQYQRSLEELQSQVRSENFGVQFSPTGLNLFPIKDGKPLSPEESMALDEETRRILEQKAEELTSKVQSAMESLRTIQLETHNRVISMERSAAENGLAYIFKELLDRYQDQKEVEEYLGALREYTLANLSLFQGQEEQPTPAPAPSQPPPGAQRNPFLPYEINLLVDNGEVETLPVIVESNPTWGNLFGRIERRAVMGTYLSDHTMLKAGGVHRANGGYLILNVRDVLTNTAVWEGLKRVIRNQEARLEDPVEQFGFLAPQALRPQPIPLNIMVVLTGDELTYRLLYTHDREDLWELFKVKAEFDYQIDFTTENIQAYCDFICTTCNSEGLLPFDRDGAAQVVEYGARLVTDQHKLSSRFGQIKDLLIEADYWAKIDACSMVGGAHVKKALEERVYRHNLIEERMRRLISEGTIMVDLEGQEVGQINGLVVYELGDFSFGRPTRITAKTFTGAKGVVNIERETQLSGRIHDKGVLILSGYLGWKYAQDKPLSLSASLCFEQSYEGVEGDSASSTELYAILSSLSNLPLKQSIAITGSVNQKGEIQPIGGVNQKVEGFFDLCRIKGLTGEQGVIIPHQNVRNLMLRQDVVDAVKQSQFHIYAVKSIDEGMEVLTGVSTGERQPDGTYHEGTVNHLVDNRLKSLAESLRGYYGAILGEPV